MNAASSNATSDPTKPKSFTRFIPPTARFLMGLPFLIFGLNLFLNFIPQPAGPVPDFAIALVKTGYMMPLIACTQLLVGALLVINRFVPLALVLIAPFLVNSILFHIFLNLAVLPMAVIFVLLEIYLVWAYRKYYVQLFTVRAHPN